MVIRQSSSKVKLDCPYVLILEQSSQPALQIQEKDPLATPNNKYIFTAVIADFVPGKKNNNGREYIKQDYLKHIPYLKQKALNGNLLGELDHPEYFDIKGSKASHKILDVWYDEADDTVKIKFEILDGIFGTEARKLVDAGVPIAVSTRSAGKVDANGVVTLFKIFTVDIVIEPGFSAAVAQRILEAESFNFDTYKVYECLESVKKESILNKLELVESISNDFTKIYKINESAYFPFFDGKYAEFEIANKTNENEEMSKVNELEAQVAALNSKVAKLLENMGQPQSQEEENEEGLQAQNSQGAQSGIQIQDAQGGIQGAQPVQGGGDVLGVGGVQGAQPVQGMAQPSTPISVQPAAQPINLPPVPAPPVSSAPAMGGYDMNQIVPQLVGLVQTLITALQNTQGKVQAQDTMLNTIAESFNIENTKIVQHLAMLESAFKVVNDAMTQQSLWTGSILDVVNYNTKVSESVAMYQNALAHRVNEGIVTGKVLESKVNATEGFIQTVIQNQINETAGVVNQIASMIDEGNMVVGKTTVGGRNIKDLMANIVESNNNIIKEAKENSDYLKLKTTHDFLQFMSEADKKLFLGESLDTKQKQAVINALNTYGYFNEKDVHEIMESALNAVNTGKDGLGFWLSAAPTEYKNLFENVLSKPEQAFIINAASKQNFISKTQVNQFWANLGLEEKLKLSESKKSLLESRNNAGHSVEDHKMLVRDAERGYNEYDRQLYLSRLKGR